MQRRFEVWSIRALAALLVALAAVGLTGPARTAAAEEPVALAAITLTSFEPALPERDGTITLTGRVTNTSPDPLFRLQAIFWRNQAPITGAEGMAQALTSASNDPLGARETAVYQDLYDAAEPNLAPGDSAAFTLTADIADLELSPTDGVYLMGVHVLQNGNVVAVARTRVFVPVLRDEPESSLRMTSVVALQSRPSLIDRGVFSDDHLATEVAPRGRLTALLDAADDDDVSFAVDPLLIEELTAMKAGYQVRSGDGGSAPGTGQQAAADWLKEFEQVKADQDGYRLLYGGPDIAALVHAKQTDRLADVVAAGNGVESTRELPLLALPAGGQADAATVEAADALNPAAILLADTSAAASTPLLTGPGDAPIITFTASGSGGGPGPDPRDTAVHLQQRSLAETWIEASTATDDRTHGRVRLITAAAQARSDDAGLDAPWMERSTLTELRRGTPARWEADYRYSDTARSAELTQAQLGRVRQLITAQHTYADLFVDPESTRVGNATTAARAVSAGWRKQVEAQSAWLRPQLDSLDELLVEHLVISSTPKVSTVAQEGVVFPITIKNQLPASDSDPDFNAVKVRLVFVSDNARRLSIKPIVAPVIRADDSFTANAEVTAKANGIVPVTAQLETESGRPVGRPVNIEVQVTQNGTTGWAIALAAGIVLVASTSWRIRQVTRERNRAAAETSEPVDALSSAPPTDAGAGRAAERLDG